MKELFDTIHEELTETFISYNNYSFRFHKKSNINKGKENLLSTYKSDTKIIFLNLFAANGIGKTRLSDFITYSMGNYPNPPQPPSFFQNHIETNTLCDPQHYNMNYNIVNFSKLTNLRRLLYTERTYQEINKNTLMNLIIQNNSYNAPILPNILLPKIPIEIVNNPSIYTSVPLSLFLKNKKSISFYFKENYFNFLYCVEITSSILRIDIVAFLKRCISKKNKKQNLLNFNIPRNCPQTEKFLINFLNYLNNCSIQILQNIILTINNFRLSSEFKTLLRLINKHTPSTISSPLFSKIKIVRAYNSFFNTELFDYSFSNKNKTISSTLFSQSGSKGEALLLGLIRFSYEIQEDNFWVKQLNTSQNNIDANKNFNSDLFLIFDDFFADFDENNLYIGLNLLLSSLQELSKKFSNKKAHKLTNKLNISNNSIRLNKKINKYTRKIYLLNFTNSFQIIKCASKNLSYFKDITYKNIILNNIQYSIYKGETKIDISYHKIPLTYNKQLSFQTNKMDTKSPFFHIQLWVDFLITSLVQKELKNQLKLDYSLYNPIFHLTRFPVKHTNNILNEFKKLKKIQTNLSLVSYVHPIQFSYQLLLCLFYSHIYQTIIDEKLMSPNDYRFILFKHIVFRKVIETHIFDCLSKNKNTKTIINIAMSKKPYMNLAQLKNTDKNIFDNILNKLNISEDYIENFINEGIHNPFDMSNLLLIQNIEDEKHVNILINKYAKLYRPEYLQLT